MFQVQNETPMPQKRTDRNPQSHSLMIEYKLPHERYRKKGLIAAHL